MNNQANSGSFNPCVTQYTYSDNFSCSVIDEDNLLSWDKNPSVFMIGINIQGLLAKRDRLNSFIHSLSEKFKPPDIICIQETWLSDNKHPYSLDHYHPFVYSSRANSTGGGVGIFVRDNISFEINNALSLFVDRVYESISINIYLQSKKYTIVNLYRPPTSPGLTCNQSLDLFLSNLNNAITYLRLILTASWIVTLI